MKEYRVSLKHPNKRFTLSEDVLKERCLELIENVLLVRIFWWKRFGIDISMMNQDQMPVNRNESAKCKTLEFIGKYLAM